jgi:hypothetical protein
MTYSLSALTDNDFLPPFFMYCFGYFFPATHLSLLNIGIAYPSPFREGDVPSVIKPALERCL